MSYYLFFTIINVEIYSQIEELFLINYFLFLKYYIIGQYFLQNSSF